MLTAESRRARLTSRGGDLGGVFLDLSDLSFL